MLKTIAAFLLLLTLTFPNMALAKEPSETNYNGLVLVNDRLDALLICAVEGQSVNINLINQKLAKIDGRFFPYRRNYKYTRSG
jgi:hypothetical protein